MAPVCNASSALAFAHDGWIVRNRTVEGCALHTSRTLVAPM
jgi:hypothetical protein